MGRSTNLEYKIKYVLVVISDGELKVSRENTTFLVVLGCIAGEFNDFRHEILNDSGKIYCRRTYLVRIWQEERNSPGAPVAILFPAVLDRNLRWNLVTGNWSPAREDRDNLLPTGGIRIFPVFPLDFPLVKGRVKDC